MDTPPPSSAAARPAYLADERRAGTAGPAEAAPSRGGLAGLGRWARTLPAHVPAVLPAIAVWLVGSPALAIGWYAFSRLAYVGFLCGALLHTSGRDAPADPAAQQAAWLRFRRRVSIVMDNDAAAFCALNVITRGTLDVGLSVAWTAVLGTFLGVFGLAVKAWATASLRPGAYYWRNFFLPAERAHVSAEGPYRWLSDPMYSVGYLPLYGLAVFMRSLPGLVGAAVAQATMLFLVARVERRVFSEEHAPTASR